MPREAEAAYSVDDERASRAFSPDLAQEMQRFYSRRGRYLGRVEMASEIERIFGERILDEVCIPQGLSAGVGLALAMGVATGAVSSAGPAPVITDEMIAKLMAALDERRGVWTRQELDDLRSVAQFMAGLRSMGTIWSFVVRLVQIVGAVLFLMWALRAANPGDAAKWLGLFIKGLSGS
jgi:hypothetical protein